MSIAAKVARGSTFVFISRAVEAIVALLFTIIIARLLTESVYGLVGATLGMVGLLGLIGEFGIPTATTKYVSENIAKNDQAGLKRVIFSSIFLELLLGLTASLLCFALAGFIANEVLHKASMEHSLRTIAPMLFFWTLSHSFISTFLGFHKPEYFMVSNVLNSATRLVISVVLVYMGYGLVGAVAGYVFGSFIGLGAAAIIFFLVLRPDCLRERIMNIFGEVKTLLIYGAPVTVGTASILIYGWSDTLILTAFHPVKYVSWYNIAYGMIAMPLILSRSIKTAFLPVVSEMNARKESDLLKETYMRIFKITGLIMFPLIILIGALGSQLILVLYGQAYLPALAPLYILLVWGLVSPLSMISESIPLGLGRPRVLAKIHVSTAVLNVVLNFILIPRYAILGAAVGTMVSYIIGMGAIIILSGKMLNAHPLNRSTGKILISALVTGPVVYCLVNFLLLPFVRSFSSLQGWFGTTLSLIIGLLAGIAIYILLISALRVIDEQDLSIAEGLKFPLKPIWFNLLKKIVR